MVNELRSGITITPNSYTLVNTVGASANDIILVSDDEDQSKKIKEENNNMNLLEMMIFAKKMYSPAVNSPTHSTCRHSLIRMPQIQDDIV
jgi:hypothetical protein